MTFQVSIRIAILSIVGLAAAIMFALIGLSFYTHTERDTFQARIERIEQLDATVAELEISFLQARRAEKDFLLRLDEKFIDRHAQVIVDLKDILASANAQIAALPAIAEDLVQLEALEPAIDDYAASFADVVASYQTLGFDETLGLQGQLRQSVHEVEESLKATSYPELQVKMLMMRRHEKDFIMRGDTKYLDRLNARVEEFRAFPAAYFNSAAQQAEIDTLLGQYQSAFSSFVEESLAVSELTKILSARYAAAEPMLSSLREQISQQAREIGAQSRAAQQDLVQRSALAGVCGLLVFVLLAVILSQRIAGPLLRVKTVLEHMIDGRFDEEPPKSSIREIKAVCVAIENFRRAQVEKDRLSSEISKVISACAEGDFSRRIQILDTQSDFAVLGHGINSIGDVVQKGLSDVRETVDALAQGDLTERMPPDHKGVFAEISVAVNTLSLTLTDVIKQLADSSMTLNNTANEIAAAALEASKRGEDSAASLEETAGAIQVLTNAVNDTAGNSKQAHEYVQDAQTRVTSSLAVAAETTESINRIKDASEAISKITGLIEGISFQTSLLALNAGVEAARAGEAGAGFAVVASEVRALAQRSATATQEINELIRDCGIEVLQGVELMRRTGSELDAIKDTVGSMVLMIDQIAAAAVDQSSSLTEVNSAVTHLDQGSQQNAAMLEETAASTQLLRDEAAKLVQSVKRFKIEKDSDSVANHDTWEAPTDRVA
ncbi:methyl-accepting chemotaxis protein [Tritonibacter horizontis]|uniref:Methyl-accepting chemotaxis protein III n=1 Tax=Tritonibacter horizontis TaxID=1768241 RepID=A0A132C3Y3_9RHOB|nr:methyl-accepting chemotaxis protein [Tritonibacter horizontis]KUP94780.1 methyl-accepting chemotaxis protein III [Tritonibacter horizontis]